MGRIGDVVEKLRSRASSGVPKGPRPPAATLAGLGPLYHNYAFFGVDNEQIPGIYGPNQRAKAPILTAYIALALAEVLEANPAPTFTELFCADGYYTMVARRLGAGRSVGIDNNRDGHLPLATEIAARLGLDGVEFVEDDVNNIDSMPRVGIVANVGGLYHVGNPREILEKSHAMATDFLVVQSVVSLATTSPDYFESPAPNWDWGCRFSRESFDRMIEDLGYDVVHSHFNELTGNERPEDRGSVYYLIRT